MTIPRTSKQRILLTRNRRCQTYRIPNGFLLAAEVVPIPFLKLPASNSCAQTTKLLLQGGCIDLACPGTSSNGSCTWARPLLCSSFRSRLATTPLHFAVTSLLSGCEKDFHLPAVGP